MAGVIGTRKFVYDVWGDTVNIAARIEAASHPNRVLASAATVKKIDEGDFKLDGPHQIETKDERALEGFFMSRGCRWAYPVPRLRVDGLDGLAESDAGWETMVNENGDVCARR